MILHIKIYITQKTKRKEKTFKTIQKKWNYINTLERKRNEQFIIIKSNIKSKADEVIRSPVGLGDRHVRYALRCHACMASGVNSLLNKMFQYELATSLTLNIERYCYSYVNGLSDLWCLRGGTRQREVRYFYKPGNPSRTRGRAYLFHAFLTTTRNFNEIQRSILLIMIICEIVILLSIFICFDFGN